MTSQTYNKIRKGDWGALCGKKKNKGFYNRIIRQIVKRETRKEVTEDCPSQVMGAVC